MLELERTNPGKTVRYVKKKEDHQTQDGVIEIDLDDEPDYKGKYTLQDSGSVEDGGWSSNRGILAFVKYRAIAEEGHRKPTTKAIEDKMREKLRKKNGIVGNTYEENQKLKKKSKGRYHRQG